MIPAPFARYETTIRPEWIDHNGHMNLAYYVMVFDFATDAIFDAIGIGWGYRDATDHGTFAAETHTIHRREVLEGEAVRVATQILGSDRKRLHLAHEMIHVASGEAAAMQELMYLHVDLSVRRTAPWLRRVQAALRAATEAHAALPRPGWVGRHVALPQQSPGAD